MMTKLIPTFCVLLLVSLTLQQHSSKCGPGCISCDDSWGCNSCSGKNWVDGVCEGEVPVENCQQVSNISGEVYCVLCKSGYVTPLTLKPQACPKAKRIIEGCIAYGTLGRVPPQPKCFACSRGYPNAEGSECIKFKPEDHLPHCAVGSAKDTCFNCEHGYMVANTRGLGCIKQETENKGCDMFDPWYSQSCLRCKVEEGYFMTKEGICVQA